MKINNEFTVGVPIEEAWEAMLDLERIAPCLPGASIDEQEGEDEYKGTMAVKIGPITAKYKGTVKYEEKDESDHRAVLHATGRDARGQGTASATITSSMEETSDGTKVSVETDMKLTGRAAQFGRGIAQDVASKMLGQFSECLEQRLGGDSDEDAGETPAASETAGNGAGAASSGEGSAAGASEANGGAMVTPGGVTPGAAPGSLGAGQESTASSFARPVGSSGNGGASAGGPGSGDSGDAGPSDEEKPKSRKIEQPDPEPLDLGEMSQDAVLKRVKPVLIGAGVLLVLIWLLRRRRN